MFLKSRCSKGSYFHIPCCNICLGVKLNVSDDDEKVYITEHTKVYITDQFTSTTTKQRYSYVVSRIPRFTEDILDGQE